MNFMQPKFGAKATSTNLDVKRVEDEAFMTGKGRYTDDVPLEGALYGHVVRSPVAFADFTIDNIEDVRAMDGVHAVIVADDLAHLGGLTTDKIRPQPDGSMPEVRGIPLLAEGTVRHVGDAVAFIVARDPATARDAGEALAIAWDDREANAATDRALEADIPLVWPELGSNSACIFSLGDEAATNDAFAKAHHVCRARFVQNRLVSNYLDTRKAIGEFDAATGAYTLTAGTQGVFNVRRVLHNVVYGKDAEIRVRTHDVGGGFGPKVFCYREYVLVMEAARITGRPVAWFADRSEHFLADAHGRDNVVEAELAVDATGRVLGLRAHVTAAMGAYMSEYGPLIPWFCQTMASGAYDIPAIFHTVQCVYTNTPPTDAYRGAGRPEAAFLIEKLMSKCAREIGMTDAEIRRRNFITSEQMPYTTFAGRIYDVGEFDGHMTEALARADEAGFADRLEASRKAGRLRGLGIASYIEACAFAGAEGARLTLETNGRVTVDIGSQSNGQGHKTVFAQFAARELNLPVDAISVIQGDTDRLETGMGTGGSRSIPLGGPSVRRGAIALAEVIKKRASDMLEADAADIELVDGYACIVGTDRTVSFAEIAAAEPLRADGKWRQQEATYPNGTHICEVEIDPETGMVDIVGYTIVDDFGVSVSPQLLEGQVHGGVAQGIGQALYEDTIFDGSGQLLSASLMDYALPRADHLNGLDFSTRNVPSTHNELGIKGAGEAGAIGATPAVLNAVTDALWRAHGIGHIDMPCTPHRVWTAIRAAREAVADDR